MKNRYKQKLIFVIAILCLSLVSCKSKTEPINNIASWTLDDGRGVTAGLPLLSLCQIPAEDTDVWHPPAVIKISDKKIL